MSSFSEEFQTIVLDIGTCVTKMGYSGEAEIRSTAPTLVGRPLHPELPNFGCKDYFVGSEAEKHRAVLSLTRPIQDGIITDMNAMEHIVRCAFYNNLYSDPQNSCVLLTDKMLSPRKQRERLCQMMFEQFEVQGYYVANQAVLSMYSGLFDKTTALIVDVGEGVTEIVPVYESFVLKHKAVRTTVSGGMVTKRLADLLAETTISNSDLKSGNKRLLAETLTDLELVREIKETVASVALDYDQQCLDNQMDAIINTYTLPDGNELILDEECFRAPEVLFNPALIGSSQVGLADLIYDVVASCPIETRRELFGNILLIGGTTDMEGFAERLENDLSLRVPESVEVELALPEDPSVCTWLGGSQFAALPAFQDTMVSLRDYQERGVSHIHRKFFYDDKPFDYMCAGL